MSNKKLILVYFEMLNYYFNTYFLILYISYYTFVLSLSLRKEDEQQTKLIWIAIGKHATTPTTLLTRCLLFPTKFSLNTSRSQSPNCFATFEQAATSCKPITFPNTVQYLGLYLTFIFRTEYFRGRRIQTGRILCRANILPSYTVRLSAMAHIEVCITV